MNYEKDMQIDESALDVEWLDQASLMMKYARNAANTRRDMDQAKEALDYVKARLDSEIRTDPDKFGITAKVTEATILNTILNQQDYKNANTRFIEAKYEADIAQGAVRAVDARKDALENLVRLHGQQYFAGPKVQRDLSWERAERQKKINAGIASETTRSRK
jgi:hypothetical protein